MNLIEVIIIAVIVLFIARFIIKKLSRQSEKPSSKKKSALVVVAYIVFVIMFGGYFLGDLTKPSTVDISPVMQLENVDFSDIDMVFDKIKNSQEELEGERFKETAIRVSTRSCSYTYHDWSLPSSVYVSIEFYDDVEQAKIQFQDNLSKRSINNYRYTKVSEDIEAILSNSRVNRSPEGFFSILNRSVGTRIRVQNIIFSFGEGVSLSESRLNSNKSGQTSNTAIEKLFSVLSKF